MFARNATTDEQLDPAKELEELERKIAELSEEGLRTEGILEAELCPQ